MEKNEFLKLLPKLIREDDEIRGAIVAALSGVMATKEDIEKLIESSNKNFERMDKRFEATDKHFEAIQNTMDKRFEATDKHFEAIQNTMDKRFEAIQNTMDKRFEAIDKRFEVLIKEMRDGHNQLKASIASIGGRTGPGLENAVLSLLNDQLIKETISSSKITKEKLSDKEGKIFWKNYTTDIDVLIQNGKVILIEIKNFADNRDGYHLLKNAELYKLQFNRDYDELMIICLEIKQKNFEQLLQQNIRVIAGKIK